MKTEKKEHDKYFMRNGWNREHIEFYKTGNERILGQGNANK